MTITYQTTINSVLWTISYLKTKIYVLNNGLEPASIKSDILSERNELISFEQLENILSVAPQRILEYNAVKTALEQARKHNRVDFHNRLEPRSGVLRIEIKGPSCGTTGAI